MHPKVPLFKMSTNERFMYSRTARGRQRGFDKSTRATVGGELWGFFIFSACLLEPLRRVTYTTTLWFCSIDVILLFAFAIYNVCAAFEIVCRVEPN